MPLSGEGGLPVSCLSRSRNTTRLAPGSRLHTKRGTRRTPLVERNFSYVHSVE